MDACARDEAGRRWGHFSSGVPAFLLVYLDWRLALGIAIYFLFINAAILPRTRLGQRWLRPGEGWGGGIATFPLTVAILILVFRENSLPAAAGWCAMSFGDPSAAFLGRRRPIRACPWNRKKSFGGMLGFLIGATIGLVLIHAQHRGFSVESVSFAVIGAVAGAMLETLRMPVNDNLVVGLGVAALAAWGA